MPVEPKFMILGNEFWLERLLQHFGNNFPIL